MYLIVCYSNSNYSRSHILSDMLRKYLRRRRCKFVNLSSKDNISDIHSYAKNVPCTVPLPEPILCNTSFINNKFTLLNVIKNNGLIFILINYFCMVN